MSRRVRARVHAQERADLAAAAFDAEIDDHEAHCADCSRASRLLFGTQMVLLARVPRPRLPGSLSLALELA